MKIIGVEYNDGHCTAVDITSDGQDRIRFEPVKKGKWLRTSAVFNEIEL